MKLPVCIIVYIRKPIPQCSCLTATDHLELCFEVGVELRTAVNPAYERKKNCVGIPAKPCPCVKMVSRCQACPEHRECHCEDGILDPTMQI